MNPVVRHIVQGIESQLAKVTSKMLVTCESEAQLCRERLGSDATVLATGIDYEIADGIPSPVPRISERPRVAMIGRPVYQKAPWRFANIANAIGNDHAEFVWFGSDPNKDSHLFADSPVRTVGWLSPEELEDEMRQVDILLFPTLWEGMPYALMSAQAHGIPAVVSDIVGNRDAVIHGETGFIADNDADLMKFTRILLEDQELRMKFAHNAWKHGRTRLTDKDLGVQSIAAYGLDDL